MATKTDSVTTMSDQARAVVQRFGGQLAAMVLPNIGAFIAWGLITTLFSRTGWIPNAHIALLIDPMINYLLPVLVGYTGGRIVHCQRGAVVGAIATVGVAVGASVPMFLGAMVVGPLAAYLLKQFDERIGYRTPPGFKMLVDNFSAGIIGGIVAVLGSLSVGPIVQWFTKTLANGVQGLINLHLLPLASVIVEPAKVLFLNNAINHGILDPLGFAEAERTGKAIEFLIETNPGPGFGLLLAITLFGSTRAARATAPGAMIIEFFGGIHEIYFPYIMAQPRLILATIAGGASGVLVFSITGAGLTATPSPGSSIAVLALTPNGNDIGVILGVAISAGVSFLISAVLLKFGKGKEETEKKTPASGGGPLTA